MYNVNMNRVRLALQYLPNYIHGGEYTPHKTNPQVHNQSSLDQPFP